MSGEEIFEEIKNVNNQINDLRNYQINLIYDLIQLEKKKEISK